MKLLRRMLLINWHYMVHELIEFAPVTFLTGKNAAGKSTILDALQLVILGDTGGHYFNKAANNGGGTRKRTLRGYLRGEVSEDHEKTITLREGQFSSYIVLEFTEERGKNPVCFGVVFDCMPDGSYEWRFFSLADPLPDFHFIRDGVPLDIRGLRAWGQQRKARFEMYESNKRYQEVFLARMGNLRDKFFRLFRKAVPFEPIMDIPGFISEFVCDVSKDLDIADMRENIRHYRRMEEELRVVQARIRALEEMDKTYQSRAAAEQKIRLYEYLLDRAALWAHEQALAERTEQLAACERETAEVDAELTRASETRDRVQARRDDLLEERAKSDVYQRKQQLEQRKQLLETRFQQIRRDGERIDRFLVDHGGRWDAVHRALAEVPDWFRENGAEGTDLPEASLWQSAGLYQEARDRLALGLRAWPKPAGWSRHQLLDPPPATADADAITESSQHLAEAARLLHDAHGTLRTTVRAWEEESAALERAIDELRRGVKQYDRKVLDLRDALRRGLAAQGLPAEVEIFADLLDVRDPAWQAAIEGYLHTQRFYLLVAPEAFTPALRIYDQVKREKNLFDVGLVDIAKVMQEKPERQAGSLAEEIVTDNPYARAYADFLLGRVMKVHHVDDLRRHRTAITRDGMLYQNYVARQLNPRRWETLYIGKRAIQQQLEQKTRRLERVREHLSAFRPRLARVREWAAQPVPAPSELAAVAEFADAIRELAGIRADYRQVLDDLGALDLSRLLRISEEIEACEAELRRIHERIETLRDRRGRLWAQRDRLMREDIPAAERAVADQKHLLSTRYDPLFRADVGEPRFEQEFKRLGSPETIQANFGRQLSVERNRAQEAWTALVQQRELYNRQFGAGFDIQRPDNQVYDQELAWLRDTQLTEYETHIREAKERAQVQFQEDFVNKLRNNIETVRQQIEEINGALREVSFGGRERYQFKVSPNPQYERFYAMIMDELLLEGKSLFSQAFLDKHGDTIEELFRHIVDVDERDPAVLAELERNLEKFTDYRTYLDFDLEVKDEEGRISRLSRVIAKKSGGETQTPFYIAVLASFAQVYRVNQPGFDNTLRLIAFDEAYNKMDHQRIRDSIQLVRDLNLQVILAAPTEKIADIVPCVDRTIVVQRIKSETRVAPFEPLAREEVLR
ncbi:ATP-binding protein [Alicyclobacillus sp.]|uniref:ATP-binding protein n=1 Tax=Alicyclobacillus sp. TaxID=61169 RepID=UPI0025C5FC5F|nr:SbcC/MukB-like Walker B domain-containing protein [Alicyclobacillus sp.]MCL6517895.1 AAA family ATPase [Alicyclobacillus sp.]